MNILTRLKAWWSGPHEQPTTFNGKPYTLAHGGIMTRPEDRWTDEEVRKVFEREAPRSQARLDHLRRKQY